MAGESFDIFSSGSHGSAKAHEFEKKIRGLPDSQRREFGVYYTRPFRVAMMTAKLDRSVEKDLELEGGILNKELIIFDLATGPGSFPVAIIKLAHKKLIQRGASQDEITASLLDLVHNRLIAFDIMQDSVEVARSEVTSTLIACGVPHGDIVELMVVHTDSLSGWDWPRLLSGKRALLPDHEPDDLAKNQKNRIQSARYLAGVCNPPYRSSTTDTPRPGLHKMYQKRSGMKRGIGKLNDLYLQFIALHHALIASADKGTASLITSAAYLTGPGYNIMRKKLIDDFPLIRIQNLMGRMDDSFENEFNDPASGATGITRDVATIELVKPNSNSSSIEYYQRSEVTNDAADRREWADFTGQKLRPIILLDPKRPTYSFNASKFVESKFQRPLESLFIVPGQTGIKTDIGGTSLLRRDFQELKVELKDSYFAGKEKKGSSLHRAKKREMLDKLWTEAIKAGYNTEFEKKYVLRAFDLVHVYAEPILFGNKMRTLLNWLQHSHTLLLYCRQYKGDRLDRRTTSVVDCIFDCSSFYASTVGAPEYTLRAGSRTLNLKENFIRDLTAMGWSNDQISRFFDYVLAVTFSSDYSQHYKKILVESSPIIPIARDPQLIDELISYGRELRSFRQLQKIYDDTTSRTGSISTPELLRDMVVVAPEYKKRPYTESETIEIQNIMKNYGKNDSQIEDTITLGCYDIMLSSAVVFSGVPHCLKDYAEGESRVVSKWFGAGYVNTPELSRYGKVLQEDDRKYFARVLWNLFKQECLSEKITNVFLKVKEHLRLNEE